jgi:hypothetical protein
LTALLKISTAGLLVQRLVVRVIKSGRDLSLAALHLAERLVLHFLTFFPATARNVLPIVSPRLSIHGTCAQLHAELACRCDTEALRENLCMVVSPAQNWLKHNIAVKPPARSIVS